MQWESMGFSDNPFNTNPISQTTLQLYTGREKQIQTCLNVLEERNVLLIVEGTRGVGTTSFSNYLRFTAQGKKNYFTPRNEIRVEKGWTLETLLGVIVANVVRELELFQPNKVIKDERFLKAKALSIRIAEAYRSFGIAAFGFGVNYEKAAGVNSQPMVVPSAVLGHHLEDLTALVQSLGYRYGILVQLNNLDIGEIHEESHMKYLFNAVRDYIQTPGISWILVGDIGLRRFIAQQVDRLDDIVSYEVEIDPLRKSEFDHLIEKRVAHYRSNKKAQLPIEDDIFTYLYEITKGRLRYVFGLLSRCMSDLAVGDLTDKITLDIARPMIMRLARDRVTRNGITPGEESILKLLVELEETPVSAIASKAGKSQPYISKILGRLVEVRLATVRQYGKNRFYSPVIDAIIAYS